MKPTEYQHIIFVRPPNSWTWTLHMNKPVAGGHHATPWRSGDAASANKEACNIVEHSTYCAIVVPVKLPQEQDAELYAQFADGDTLYKPSEPYLVSKATGKPMPDGIPEGAE